MWVGLIQLLEGLKRRKWGPLRSQEFCLQTASGLMQHYLSPELPACWYALRFWTCQTPHSYEPIFKNKSLCALPWLFSYCTRCSPWPTPLCSISKCWSVLGLGLDSLLLVQWQWARSVAQLCLTLYDPTDCSQLGSSIHGIFQARILEWVASSYSRGSSWLRDWTHVSCSSSIGG